MIENKIIIVCPNCGWEVIGIREPRVDPPAATYMELLCPQCDDGEGFPIPTYKDVNHGELCADPESENFGKRLVDIT